MRCVPVCAPVLTDISAGRWTTDEESVLDDRHTWASGEVTVVSERALAAVTVEGGGQVEIYHSRCAGAESRLRRVLHKPGDPLDALDGVGWQYRGRQDRTAFPGAVDTLGVDVVYLLPDRGVRVYLPVWLGLPGTVEQTGTSWVERTTNGVLVRVKAFGECRHLRAEIRFLKELFYGAVRRGWFNRRVAHGLLALALRSDHTPGRVHTPGTPL